MLPDIENFRDFGGYAAGAGRRVKAGLLFRSAHLGDATPNDLALIDALNISTIVDLRRREERLGYPYPAGPWTNGRQIINSDIGGDDDPWLVFLRQGDISVAAIRDYGHRFYVEVPLDPRYVDLFARYLQALATKPGASLIHCAAGKDRTGMIVALTQTLLGVHRDDIVANFLLTNQVRRYENLKDLVTRIMTEESGGRVPSDEAVRIAIEVDTVFLDASFAAIIQQCGSLDRYFRDVLGLQDDQRLAIIDRLTE